MTFDIPYDLMQDMQNINSVQPRFEVDMCEIFLTNGTDSKAVQYDI